MPDQRPRRTGGPDGTGIAPRGTTRPSDTTPQRSKSYAIPDPAAERVRCRRCPALLAPHEVCLLAGFEYCLACLEYYVDAGRRAREAASGDASAELPE